MNFSSFHLPPSCKAVASGRYLALESSTNASSKYLPKSAPPNSLPRNGSESARLNFISPPNRSKIFSSTFFSISANCVYVLSVAGARIMNFPPALIMAFNGGNPNSLRICRLISSEIICTKNDRPLSRRAAFFDFANSKIYC